MATPIEIMHPELFHYTGINGLKGILENQTLWATHAGYLNDAMELKAFKERLPSILQPNFEGYELNEAKEVVERIIEMLYYRLFGDDSSPNHISPYILSFCTAEKDSLISKHGLLSQWRGYGPDGGYALVFDTAKLVSLLEQEREISRFSFIGDEVIDTVVYSPMSSEMSEDLEIISECFSRYMNTKDKNSFEALYTPLVRCMCRYKHWGFHEEKEVRVIAIPANEDLRDKSENKDYHSQLKSPHHYVRNGTPVPCLHLFEEVTKQRDNLLPITRIIIGPHRDKEQRQHAVKNLVAQYQLNINDISVSEIPYVGNF